MKRFGPGSVDEHGDEKRQKTNGPNFTSSLKRKGFGIVIENQANPKRQKKTTQSPLLISLKRQPTSTLAENPTKKRKIVTDAQAKLIIDDLLCDPSEEVLTLYFTNLSVTTQKTYNLDIENIALWQSQVSKYFCFLVNNKPLEFKKNPFELFATSYLALKKKMDKNGFFVEGCLPASPFLLVALCGNFEKIESACLEDKYKKVLYTIAASNGHFSFANMELDDYLKALFIAVDCNNYIGVQALLNTFHDISYDIKFKAMNDAMVKSRYKLAKTIFDDILNPIKMAEYQLALQNTNPTMAQQLMGNLSSDLLIASQQFFIMTALHGSVKEIKQLLLNIPGLSSGSKSHALRLAASFGSGSVVKELLANKACTFYASDLGTICKCAMANGNFTVVKRFLEHFESQYGQDFVKFAINLLVTCLVNHKSAGWVNNQINHFALYDEQRALLETLLPGVRLLTFEGVGASIDIRIEMATLLKNYLSELEHPANLAETITPLRNSMCLKNSNDQKVEDEIIVQINTKMRFRDI